MKGYEHLRYSRTDVASDQLLRSVKSRLARERVDIADDLADMAEIDRRKIFRVEGYPSMFEYCVRELHLSEASAFKRIRAARAARRFPAIFTAVVEGRLHLSAIGLLAVHLTRENADELLSAATHLTKEQLQRLLAARFPSPDVPTLVRAMPTAHRTAAQLAPGPVEASAAVNPTEAVEVTSPFLAPSPSTQLAPGPVRDQGAAVPGLALPVPAPARVTPLAPERYALQVTIPQTTREKLRRAQELLGHKVAPGDLATVLDRALDALIVQLEKRKFAATDRPKAETRAPQNPRTIPAAVRRAVHTRDQGRCTFVSHDGTRCAARSNLEYDHAIPIAAGGASTEANVRLLCRTHNQLEADRVFGAEFMRKKRAAG